MSYDNISLEFPQGKQFLSYKNTKISNANNDDMCNNEETSKVINKNTLQNKDIYKYVGFSILGVVSLYYIFTLKRI